MRALKEVLAYFQPHIHMYRYHIYVHTRAPQTSLIRAFLGVDRDEQSERSRLLRVGIPDANVTKGPVDIAVGTVEYAVPVLHARSPLYAGTHACITNSLYGCSVVL